MSTYKINSYIEGIKCRHGRTVIIGWAFGAQPSGQARFREIQIDILEKGRPVADTRVTWTQRPDIMASLWVPRLLPFQARRPVSDGAGSRG